MKKIIFAALAIFLTLQAPAFAARKIIIQERIQEPSDFDFRVVYWLAVQAQRQPFYANASASSSVKDVTAQELQDIRDGKVREVSELVHYAPGTAIASIKTDLVNKYNALQTILDALNPWKFFGSFWDGTSWTNGGVN